MLTLEFHNSLLTSNSGLLQRPRRRRPVHLRRRALPGLARAVLRGHLHRCASPLNPLLPCNTDGLSQTLRLGYRDPVDLTNITKPIRDRIVALEAREGPEVAKERANMIDAAMENAVTHMCGPVCELRKKSRADWVSLSQPAALPRHGGPDRREQGRQL